MQRWGVFDTGLLGAAENIAWDRVLLEARAEGRIGNLLRFLRFTPSALIGRHQSLAQELDLDYCAAQGIEAQRRITGGGAIYFDPAQLGWELFADRRAFGAADMDGIARRACEAAAEGLCALGVDARFRPRNDIEVEGRKVSGTGGAVDGSAVMYQGTLLLDFDAAAMLRVLRVPAAKLESKAVASVRERVASLTELLGQPPALETVKAALVAAFGRAFGVAFHPWEPPPEWLARHARMIEELRRDDWLQEVSAPPADAPLGRAERKFPGGLLCVAVSLDRRRRFIKQAWFTGDFFAYPARRRGELEAALRDMPLDEAVRRIHDLAGDGFSIAAEEIAHVLALAVTDAERHGLL